MSKDSIRFTKIDQIVEKTIGSIEKGKKEIFQIAEDSRKEGKDLEDRLNGFKETIKITINEVERLERLEKQSRYNLMTTSSKFDQYDEEDIRKSYEATKDLQVELILQRKKVEQLISQRKDVEQRLNSVRSTLMRAEFITSHIASAMNYLNMALANMDDAIVEVQKREELGVQIIMAQEEERQRVAREIHDGPAQSLSSLVLKSDLCGRLIDIDISRARDEINDLQNLARVTLKDIRKIIFDLRPMSLDDLGLIPALKQYINRFIDETSIDVVLQAYQEHIHIDSLIEVAVFRIIQEALNNIFKHANSPQAYIYLSIQEDILLCSIIDKGIGFEQDDPQERIDRSSISGGFGIYGMKQRADLLKGRLKIKSQIGKGTTVRVEIPLNS